MTKDELQTRIAQINNEMIQTKANYAKLEGHLGEAQHWLTVAVDKEEGVREAEGMHSGNEPEVESPECSEDLNESELGVDCEHEVAA